MADPKYQNLPYIAVGQADVYETGDLPESEQVQYETQEQDTVVEQLLVDPKDAFKRFNKATVDSTGSNFSEEAVSGRTGYSVHYEILPGSQREEETILQKLQRLKFEIKEIEDAAKTRFTSDEVSPASIMSEVETLQRQLDSFTAPSLASNEGNDAAYAQLLSQLKSSPQKKSGTKGAPPSGGAEANTALYELNYVADTSLAAREASLEARLHRLEEILGTRSTQKAALSESIGGESVMDAINILSSKLHLLDEDKVDKLSARLQILLQTVSKLNESSATSDARDMDKVNELYELVKKWDTCADSLPAIVDRLYTLQDLHQQAMEFSSSLKALESAQAELTANLGSHTTLLTDVQKTFASNVDTIKSNVENLEKRMANLK